MAALHERLVFDTARGEVRDADRRYLLLRADVLMGLFDALPEGARAEALQAFGRSLALHGADSVRAYAVSIGPVALCAAMEEAAASLGWGRWRFDAHNAGASPALTLEVGNSPFAAAAGRRAEPVCHAIAGMLEALGQALWQQPVQSVETRCAAVAGSDRCRFAARPLAAASEDPRVHPA